MECAKHSILWCNNVKTLCWTASPPLIFVHDCTWIVHTYYTHESKGNKPSVLLFTMWFVLSRLSLRAFYHTTHQLECYFTCQDYYRPLYSIYYSTLLDHPHTLQGIYYMTRSINKSFVFFSISILSFEGVQRSREDYTPLCFIATCDKNLLPYIICHITFFKSWYFSTYT